MKRLAVWLSLVLGLQSQWMAASDRSQPSPEVVAELCTSEWRDVLPNQVFRLTITRGAGRYTVDFVRLYDNDDAPSVVYWESGYLPRERFVRLWRQILDLRPASIRSEFPSPPDDIGVAQSWVTLRLDPRDETRLFFAASPAGRSGRTPLPIPAAGVQLLDLLWECRGLATDTNMFRTRPPDFSGHCFRPSTQEYLNSKLRTAHFK